MEISSLFIPFKVLNLLQTWIKNGYLFINVMIELTFFMFN